MTTDTKLSNTQRAVLEHAIQHTGGTIEWFPDSVKGGARQKVLDGLFNRALVSRNRTKWFVAAEGYDALGVARPSPAMSKRTGENKTAQTAAKSERAPKKTRSTATPPAAAHADKPHVRDNTKQAQVIAMLRRPTGATISEICAATGWQQHTVRGTFAGAFKKKLGLTITSSKEEGGERCYHII